MSNPQEEPTTAGTGQPGQAEPGAGRQGPARTGQMHGASATATGGRSRPADTADASGTTTSARTAEGATGQRRAAGTGVREQEAGRDGEREPAGGYQPGMAPPPGYGAEPGTASAVGGILCVVTGLMTFLAGLAAVVRANYYPVVSGYAYQWNTHDWGWALVGLGIVLFAAGACALLGLRWARAVGIGLAVLGAVGGFLFLAYAPLWGVIIVALSLFTIWGLLHDTAIERTYG